MTPPNGFTKAIMPCIKRSTASKTCHCGRGTSSCIVKDAYFNKFICSNVLLTEHMESFIIWIISLNVRGKFLPPSSNKAIMLKDAIHVTIIP
jgi:hypothetical protein